MLISQTYTWLTKPVVAGLGTRVKVTIRADLNLGHLVNNTNITVSQISTNVNDKSSTNVNEKLVQM